ncbi:UvrD-helicase domain-containing protein [Candidatus Vallotiella sp. (ex Adelges kitamiensis)]|uniref:UvrD-helicase domain-containing protein n=1 Tax=Candidatus Vallotiella sp. (ex Adelges kitamiensis) TaxID=2864217 RepID=UPI001CE2BF15|nr:UvrD-helicase domain-containing protein [Candidatus Vallotia sp. (ex Adelges kitamiensis)]
MSDLLANLNPEQFAAVTLPNEPALILAGAGSGKTRVLITRIAWLISCGEVSATDILAVTFTNKAAREMLMRLGVILPINTHSMWIGTFHGLCNRMLRTHYQDAGLPQTFQILDAADQLTAIKRLMKSLKVNDEKCLAKNLQHFINNAKEKSLAPEEVNSSNNFNHKWVELYFAYEQQCQREGVVDFSELLLRSYKLLQHNSTLRSYYQTRFQHILVDEFQDTSKLQYAWVKLLAGERNGIFAVGDDDQSIYAFRGAHAGNMLDFEREFNIRHLIKLEQNYRSHGNILDAANMLIAHNAKRLGKNLRTNACHGKLVQVYEATTDSKEASWIVEEVRALIDTGLSPDEIAVLYRSNMQSRMVEHMLVNAGISYRVYGGLRFFERQEIKHALAYLRLMNNVNDDTAFNRVINFPARGIGTRSIEQLANIARIYSCSMMQAIPYVTGRAGQLFSAFLALIEQMYNDTQAMSLPEIVEGVIKSSGLEKFYSHAPENQERIENLRELVNAASAYVVEEGYDFSPAYSISPARSAKNYAAMGRLDDNNKKAVPKALSIERSRQDLNQMTPISGFLSHASLESGDNQANTGKNVLQLMTVHASKGLEFSAVFVTGLEEGLFPHENSLIKLDGLEEERRLMYVAITRAKESLYLSFAQSRMLHGKTRYNVRSRFFDELPARVLQWTLSKTESSLRPLQHTNLIDNNTGWNHDWFSQIQQQRDHISYTSTCPDESIPVTKNSFRIGISVFHPKFGEGTITGLEGDGADAKARVTFKQHGTKWLALAISKLQTL